MPSLRSTRRSGVTCPISAARNTARREARQHGGHIRGRNRQEITVARKRLQPAVKRDALRFRHAPHIDRRPDAGTFGKHHRRANEAALRNVFGGLRKLDSEMAGSRSRSARSRSDGASVAASQFENGSR